MELSGDGGTTWDRIGAIVRAATVPSQGGAAYSVAGPGRVAGVTGSAIIVRLPSATGVRLIRIVAAGEKENDATVATDILPGTACFRSVAPVPGTPVQLERDGVATPMPEGYTPKTGDRYLLPVRVARSSEPTRIEFENKPDGAVVLHESGELPRLIGRTRHPLLGIGRYLGTDRAGAGSLLAWSPTLITIGTAGTARRLGSDGEPLEERGGFIIQPSEPALTGTTHPASQVLVEAIETAGKKPPVSDLFTLGFPLSSLDPLEAGNARVEVRIDGGSWEPFPDLRDAIPETDFPAALRKALGPERKLKDGITHFRIVAASLADRDLRRRVRLAAAAAEHAPQRGKVTITAGITGGGISEVEFRLNGRLTKISNIPPFAWVWDTTAVANGEHLVEIRGLSRTGEVLTTVARRVVVDN